LEELITISHDLKLIFDEAREAANLARKYRNLTHPVQLNAYPQYAIDQPCASAPALLCQTAMARFQLRSR